MGGYAGKLTCRQLWLQNTAEKLNKLLHQNISIRLDNVENKFWELSNAVHNMSSIPDKYKHVSITLLNERSVAAGSLHAYLIRSTYYYFIMHYNYMYLYAPNSIMNMLLLPD